MLKFIKLSTFSFCSHFNKTMYYIAPVCNSLNHFFSIIQQLHTTAIQTFGKMQLLYGMETGAILVFLHVFCSCSTQIGHPIKKRKRK